MSSEARNDQMYTVELLTIEQVCQILKYERHFIYRLINKKELKAIKQKGWKVPRASVEKYIERIMNSD